MITDETKRSHRATWWVYAGTERIRHTAAMRGSWGYDVTCSCGWDSKTGGGLRRYVAWRLEDHRAEAAYDEDRDDTGRAERAEVLAAEPDDPAWSAWVRGGPIPAPCGRS